MIHSPGLTQQKNPENKTKAGIRTFYPEPSSTVLSAIEAEKIQ